MVATSKVSTKVKKKPIKAGSTRRKHGGFPTQKVITISTKIRKKDGQGVG